MKNILAVCYLALLVTCVPTQAWVWTAVGTIAGTGAAIVAGPAIVTGGLAYVGFTGAGVAGGSVAAGLMATFGPATAGSAIAIAQSVGAAGLGAAGMAVVGLTGAAVGAGVGTAMEDDQC